MVFVATEAFLKQSQKKGIPLLKTEDTLLKKVIKKARAFLNFPSMK